MNNHYLCNINWLLRTKYFWALLLVPWQLANYHNRTARAYRIIEYIPNEVDPKLFIVPRGCKGHTNHPPNEQASDLPPTQLQLYTNNMLGLTKKTYS